MRSLTLWLCCWGLCGALGAQQLETAIKIYDFDDGLSHRNVFQITQDHQGILWMATINGLNRFDGYEFRAFNPASTEAPLPNEVVSALLLQPDSTLMLASPDFLTQFDPRRFTTEATQIKKGEIIRRQALSPNNLAYAHDRLWCTVYDEKVGKNWLAYFEEGQLTKTQRLVGSSTNRPVITFQNRLYLAAGANELWLIREDARVQTRLMIGSPTPTNPAPRIVDLEVQNNGLYILLNDGRIYLLLDPDDEAQLHLSPPTDLRVGSLCVENDGDCWIGGLGVLWQYDHWEKSWNDFDPDIRQRLRNTCTYRQIIQDDSEVIWLATDFGAIRVVQSDKLFTQYLSGGSEYCSNVYCSTRGITEDENGQIYIAYYNSIHVLNPQNNAIRPLFPNNDYFNFPFGIAYHKGALYTGNGIRIRLNDLHRDTLFNLVPKDLGAVLVDRRDRIWLGYEYNLFTYEPNREELITFSDAQGAWDSLSGTISYLYQAPDRDDIWVATLDNGLHHLSAAGERIEHWTADIESPVQLPHNQVNALYQAPDRTLWLATASGLTRIAADRQEVETYTTSDGLPYNFINGMLPEGDSCLWVSTDNGLCRFSFANNCLNFYTTDGLSANEFNRISFYKSINGRMYFGGLNGVNAFYPDARYLQRKQERNECPLVMTAFSYLDGASDSLIRQNLELRKFEHAFELEHNDRMFTAEFALLDYHNSEQNSFQSYLEGYESGWSASTQVHSVRYTDLPPGDYALHVRARAGRESWNEQMLTIPITIQPAFYQRWWFWPLLALLAVAAIFGLMQYRLRLLQQRRKLLEMEVQNRTRELQAEQQKSEELLLNILPVELAKELKENGFAKAKRHEQVTVMFSDFKGFSRISELLEPEELVAEIDLCFRAFDEITERHDLEKIKTIGDAYLLVGGISENPKDQARKVVLAALEIQEFMAAIAVERQLHEQHFFEARIGIHTGPIVAGIVGIKKFAYDIWGETVNIASRMETNSKAGRVNLSSTTYALIEQHFHCVDNGNYAEHNTALDMYLVEDVKESNADR